MLGGRHGKSYQRFFVQYFRKLSIAAGRRKLEIVPVHQFADECSRRAERASRAENHSAVHCDCSFSASTFLTCIDGRSLLHRGAYVFLQLQDSDPSRYCGQECTHVKNTLSSIYHNMIDVVFCFPIRGQHLLVSVVIPPKEFRDGGDVSLYSSVDINQLCIPIPSQLRGRTSHVHVLPRL